MHSLLPCLGQLPRSSEIERLLLLNVCGIINVIKNVCLFFLSKKSVPNKMAKARVVKRLQATSYKYRQPAGRLLLLEMEMMEMRLMSRKGKPTEPPCKTKPSGKVWPQLKKSSHTRSTLS